MSEPIDVQLIQEALEMDKSILLKDIQREKARLDAYSEENPDPFDLADLSRYQGISLNRLEHMENWLEQVEAALLRIREGRYGICVSCGKVINPERLEAMPAAAYCMKCQKKQESRPY
jgi:RNA polymerase-binding transcription factor